MISSWWLRSRLLSGSSSSRTGVSWARVWAMRARWRSPPESSVTRRPARAVEPVASRAAATAAPSAAVGSRAGAASRGARRMAGRAVGVAAHGHHLLNSEAEVKVELLGDHPDQAGQFGRAVVAERAPFQQDACPPTG